MLDAVETSRKPPADEAIEAALLGALLIRNRDYARMADTLKPEHFSVRLFGRIYDAIGSLVDRNEDASPLTLAGLFASDEAMKAEGGSAFLFRLGGKGATVGAPQDLAKRIVTLAQLRKLYELGEDMTTFAADPDVGDAFDLDVNAAALKFETALGSIAGAELAERTTVGIQKASRASLARLQVVRAQSGLVGTTTGISDLDDMIGGLHAPDLVIVGGRPGMGKTALMTTIAHAAARKPSQRTGAAATVAIFSMEMSAEQLAQRILAEITGVSAERQRLGQVDDMEFEKLEQAAAELNDLPIFIDDTPALTIGSLRSRARRLARRHGVDLILVDYLQLMAGASDRKGDNRVQELSQITGGLKALAKELDVPVVVLSQLSRAVESRDDKRPNMADLRDSGSIEQDADIVLFCYREEYYLHKQQPTEKTGEEKHAFAGRYADWQASMDRAKGIGEILIDKNRNGTTGKLLCRFDGAKSCWGNLARGYH